MAPALATSVSKTIAVPFSLHFEQIATRRQGGLPGNPLKFNFDGLGFILGREVLFSAVFWTCNEILFKMLHDSLGTVSATTLSAFLSGLAGGVASYPMDALRTWKINFPEKFKDNSSWNMVKQIQKERGTRFLFSGRIFFYGRSVTTCT